MLVRTRLLRRLGLQREIKRHAAMRRGRVRLAFFFIGFYLVYR